MTHATAIIGDYEIPLIGIPEDATQDVCFTCGKTRHLTRLHWVNGKLFCFVCIMQYHNTCDAQLP